MNSNIDLICKIIIISFLIFASLNFYNKGYLLLMNLTNICILSYFYQYRNRYYKIPAVLLIVYLAVAVYLNLLNGNEVFP